MLLFRERHIAMRLLPFLTALVLSVTAYAQLDMPYQISYATNLAAGDSYVTVTNSGINDTATLPIQNGNICVNVYTYDPSEEMISCCSCPVTPNALQFLSVKKDLIANTLTPSIPNSVVIKLLASAGPTCNAATVGTAPNLGVSGLLAWSTTLAETSAGVYTPERTPFIPASLGSAELKRMASLCGFIHANGSGYGTCAACRIGAAGGGVKD